MFTTNRSVSFGKTLYVAHVAAVVGITIPLTFAQSVSPAKSIPGASSSAGAPIGIAATTNALFYSEPYCQTTPGTRVINSVNPATGVISPFITLPDEIVANSNPTPTQALGTCAENYFAVSLGQGSFASDAGDIFVSVLSYTGAGPYVVTDSILQYPSTGGNTPIRTFATPGTSTGNHTGVAFDTVGTFQNALLVTGEQGVTGYVPSAAGTGTVLFSYPLPSADAGTYILENATVAPITYAPCKGCMLIAAENINGGAGLILDVPPGTPSGTPLAVFSSAQTELEALSFPACTLDNYSYFVSGYGKLPQSNFSTTGQIFAYTPAQTGPYAGQFLAPDEGSGTVNAYSAPNKSTVFSTLGYQLESATTVPCAPVTGCTLTQGGYKNHFNAKVTGLMLGSVAYSASQINAILQNNAVAGNGLISLAHQLITADLNVIYGAAPDPATQAAINQANALIGNLVIPPIGTGFIAPSAESGIESILDAFNNRGPECNQ